MMSAVLSLGRWVTRSCRPRVAGSLGHQALWNCVNGPSSGRYGTQSRSRTCTPGRHGGRDCVGDSTQTQDCNVQPCPGSLYKLVHISPTWTTFLLSVLCNLPHYSSW